jgi:oxygen-independent coproporphyrinogen-3 oxidase
MMRRLIWGSAMENNNTPGRGFAHKSAQSLHLNGAQAESEFIDALGRLASSSQAPSVGAYMHLPFCPQRCLTCDRVTTSGHPEWSVDAYLVRLEREMSAVSRHLSDSVSINRLHVGGGTPNTLNPSQLIYVRELADRHLNLAADVELSIEVNPKRCSHSQLELLRGLGFTELTLEVNAVDSVYEYSAGRSCSPELLQDVFADAKAVGFHRVNLDYIYGLPDHDANTVWQTVEALIDLGADRIMCHPFTRREEQFPHQQLIAAELMPSIAAKMAMFVIISELLTGAGYEWLGINGFVMTGDPLLEAQARGDLFRGWLGYNDNYQPWLLGFGMGAFSELPGLVSHGSTDPEQWAADVDAFGMSQRAVSLLSNDEATERDIFKRLGASMRASSASLNGGGGTARLDAMTQGGLIEQRGEVLSLTPIGRYELNQHWASALQHQRAAG